MKARARLILRLVPGGGCTHPIDIVGEGDIRSGSGSRDCLLEGLHCRGVAVSEYIETYIPQPRSGYSFVGWDNCLSQDGDNCVFNVAAATVQQNWFRTMPALVAKFAPLCESAPVDSFAAIQAVIFDGKGCSGGGCHSGSFQISGNPMPLAVTALSADQLAALALWIDAGAPQFGRAGELNEIERLLGLCN